MGGKQAIVKRFPALSFDKMSVMEKKYFDHKQERLFGPHFQMSKSLWL